MFNIYILAIIIEITLGGIDLIYFSLGAASIYSVSIYVSILNIYCNCQNETVYGRQLSSYEMYICKKFTHSTVVKQ